MDLKQKVLVFSLLLCLSFLYGCEQNAKDEDNSIVQYEYLSLDEEYPAEIMDWLNEARNNKDELHHLSLEEGEEYIYGKGYSHAKVLYTYEDIEGKEKAMKKATLL